MSINFKHYVAAGLGFAVCAAFVMHRPASPSQPVEFQAESGVFSPLSSLDAYRQENSTPNPEVQAIALAEPQIAPEVLVGKLMEQVDQITIAELENDLAPTQFKNETSLELSAIMETDAEIISKNHAVEDKILVPVDPEPTRGLEPAPLQVTESSSAFGPGLNSLTHHADRPNSRWKKNPFMDQANRPLAATPTTEQKPVIDPEPSIIVEPIEPGSPNALLSGLADATPLTQPALQSTDAQPSQADRSVLVKFDEDQLSDTDSMERAGRVPPNMPTQLTLPNRLPQIGYAPDQLGISETVALQAVHHIEYGKSLARRGATLAASEEFLLALNVIAQSNDVTSGSNEFSVALAQAVLAMKEATEFASPNLEVLMIAEVSGITESHRSNIISPTQAKTTTPSQAMQTYFAFAKQKLDEAGGRNVVTAEALYCLGKLHTSVAVNKSVPDKIDIAKAITYHQAALLSDKNNYRSANELGVLMARTGQLDKATKLFKQSLIVNATPETWKNLAKAHRRLGQTNLAQLAETEFVLAAQTNVSNSSSRIQWMPTTRFIESAPVELNDNTRVAAKPADVKQESEPQPESENKSFGERLKDLF